MNFIRFWGVVRRVVNKCSRFRSFSSSSFWSVGSGQWRTIHCFERPVAHAFLVRYWCPGCRSENASTLKNFRLWNVGTTHAKDSFDEVCFTCKTHVYDDKLSDKTCSTTQKATREPCFSLVFTDGHICRRSLFWNKTAGNFMSSSNKFFANFAQLQWSEWFIYLILAQSSAQNWSNSHFCSIYLKNSSCKVKIAR